MKQVSDITQSTTQRHVLSPQQVQFVRLLEMTGPEIEDDVRKELDENPALEIVDASTDSMQGNDDEGNAFNETSDDLVAADYSDEDEMPAYLVRKSSERSVDSDSRSAWYEHSHESPTLLESLNTQLDFVDASRKDIVIARYLIGYLDANGRLSRSLREIAEDIAEATGSVVTRADLLPALDIIRYHLDPPGLGAVDLRECLLIQLRRKEPKTLAIRAAEEIVCNNFDLFTKKHYDRLKNAIGIDRTTLEEALDVIRSLDPKPGSSLEDIADTRSAQITPDFIITADEDHPGRFVITLNQYLPELAVEQSYLVDSANREVQAFQKEKRDQANTYISMLRRRSETLMTVMKAIVDVQHRFFETEDKATLRPMILETLSEMTGYDKSVISRATSNKFVATRSGIYPLRMFFNDKPTNDADISSSEVAARLRQLIDNEDKRKPLSDQALTDSLNAVGYALARRTITKYREKMNIPVARLRKEI